MEKWCPWGSDRVRIPKRRLLWAAPVALLAVASVLAVRKRLASRPPETCPGHAPPAFDSLTARPAQFRLLVLTAARGYVHRSTPAAILALHDLGARHGFAVGTTAAPEALRDTRLRDFAAVVLLQTTGDFLDSAEQVALQRYVHGGGNVIGIHAALDAEPEWAWYHRLLGAEFAGHPAVQRATLEPGAWTRTDEWYNYRALPAGVDVLLRVDERSYRGGRMGPSHPVSWRHQFEGGRVWYTAMGHGACSYVEPRFLAHLLDGIRWAARGESRAPD
jgi:type 1 glutamine amidotransferase